MNAGQRVIRATVVIPPEANWHPPQEPLARPVALRPKTRWQSFQEWMAGLLVGWGATRLALKHKDAAAVIAGIWLKNKVDREREEDGDF